MWIKPFFKKLIYVRHLKHFLEIIDFVENLEMIQTAGGGGEPCYLRQYGVVSTKIDMWFTLTFLHKNMLEMVCNFIKNKLQHRCSPVNIKKFLRTPLL